MDNIKLLQKLVQIPSYSGHEKRLARFIVNYCKKNKLPAETHRGNVIIHFEGKSRSKALIFNAHMDTVNVGNKTKWKYPPIGKNAGKIINGKIYGLGASDDKAAIAAMLLYAKKINKPPCDLWFTFVTQEETKGRGTALFLNWFTKLQYFKNYKYLAAIIGEPTGLKNLEIGHRGNAFIIVKTTGISGHGAKEYRQTELALGKMINVVTKLKQAVKNWQQLYKDDFLGVPSMNITFWQTRGGRKNRIPDQCFVQLDIVSTISV